MSDKRMRELERAAKRGDAEAQEALQRDMERTGRSGKPLPEKDPDDDVWETPDPTYSPDGMVIEQPRPRPRVGVGATLKCVMGGRSAFVALTPYTVIAVSASGAHVTLEACVFRDGKYFEALVTKDKFGHDVHPHRFVATSRDAFRSGGQKSYRPKGSGYRDGAWVYFGVRRYSREPNALTDPTPTWPPRM